MQSALNLHTPHFSHHRHFMIIAVIWFLVPMFKESEVLAETLILKDSQYRYRLMDYLEFLEDPDGVLTIDEAAAESNLPRFEPRWGKRRNFGFSNAVFWARLRIDNQSSQRVWMAIVYRIYNKVIDRIDLYQPTSDGAFQHSWDGQSISASDTGTPKLSIPALKIEIPPGRQQTLYFRIEDEGLLFLPIELTSIKPRLDFNKKYFFYIFLLGAFALFFLNNLLVYWSLRDPVFIYFNMVLLGFPLAVLMGIYSNILPDLSVWWSNRLQEQLQFYNHIAWLLLAKSYYRITPRTPVLNRWIRRLLLICLIWAAGFFLLPYQWCLHASVWLHLVIDPAILAISIYYHRKGFRAGRYFLMAASFIFLTTCIRTFYILGVIPFPLFTDQDIFESIDLAFRLLFFSFALIDRHNILGEQMLKSQQSALQSMQQVETAKDEFLANTSHELRTPLSGIVGLTEDLLTRCKAGVTEGRQHQLNIIIHCARRLSTLINDLLDATRIRQGRLHLKIKAIDFKIVLRLATSLCSPLANPKKIRIQTDVPEELPLVMADEDRLQQILINLIKNAIAFTPEGFIRITAEKEEKFLKVSVLDTGIGIAEQQQAVIFDRFTQLEGSMERTSGGAGLGLSITRQLVELQGGRITVLSSLGEGACFSFTLPLAAEGIQAGFGAGTVGIANISSIAPPLPVLPDPPSSTSQDSDGTRILIIDDEQISLHVLHNHLTTAGYNVTSVRDALEAGSHLKTTPYDLIVLDLMMPHKNGYTFCREIRRDFNPTELPVIMLTACSQPDDLVKGFDCGANDYLIKPVNRAELLARIRSSLKLKQLADLLRENKKLKEEILRRKQAEQQLNEANQQLVSLLNLWEAALLLVDQRYQILYFNQCVEELFGYQPHQIIHRPLTHIFRARVDLIHQGSGISDLIGMGNAKMSCRHHRIMAYTAEDEPVALEVIVTPIMVNNGVVYALICRQTSKEEDPMRSDHAAVQTAEDHHQKIGAMQGAFERALMSLQQKERQLDIELCEIDQAMTAAYERLTEKELDLQFRKTLVELTTNTLTCWHDSTGGDKITLAKKSGIWHSYWDGGGYKTRTLDKYLNLDKLPKFPRVKDVLDTADYVLQNSRATLPTHKALNASLAQFKAIMRVKKLL